MVSWSCCAPFSLERRRLTRLAKSFTRPRTRSPRVLRGMPYSLAALRKVSSLERMRMTASHTCCNSSSPSSARAAASDTHNKLLVIYPHHWWTGNKNDEKCMSVYYLRMSWSIPTVYIRHNKFTHNFTAWCNTWGFQPSQIVSITKEWPQVWHLFNTFSKSP